MFLLLNIVIWGTAVYSLKIAVSGRPILALLVQSPRTVVEQAALALDPESPEQDFGEDVSEFLTKLARFSIFSSIMLVVEYALCFYFLSVDYLNPFAWFLVIKNLFFLMLSIHFQRQSIESNPIHALMAIPSWAIRWERITCFAGTVCFIVELMRLNNLVFE